MPFNRCFGTFCLSHQILLLMHIKTHLQSKPASSARQSGRCKLSLHNPTWWTLLLHFLHRRRYHFAGSFLKKQKTNKKKPHSWLKCHDITAAHVAVRWKTNNWMCSDWWLILNNRTLHLTETRKYVNCWKRHKPLVGQSVGPDLNFTRWLIHVTFTSVLLGVLLM